MILPSVMLRMVGTVVVLIGLVFAGGAMAKSGDPLPVAAATAVVQGLPAAATPMECGRKVKVVYAGYGEADRAACGRETIVSKAD